MLFHLLCPSTHPGNFSQKIYDEFFWQPCHLWQNKTQVRGWNTVMCLASLLLCPSCFWWVLLCDCVLPTHSPTFHNHHHQSFNWIQETPEGEGGAVTTLRPKILGGRMGAFVRGTFMCKCEGSSDFHMPVRLSYKPYLCAPKALATLTRTNNIN